MGEMEWGKSLSSYRGEGAPLLDCVMFTLRHHIRCLGNPAHPDASLASLVDSEAGLVLLRDSGSRAIWAGRVDSLAGLAMRDELCKGDAG